MGNEMEIRNLKPGPSIHPPASSTRGPLDSNKNESGKTKVEIRNLKPGPIVGKILPVHTLGAANVYVIWSQYITYTQLMGSLEGVYVLRMYGLS